MVQGRDFGEVQDVEVTILVDNRADLIVSSTDMVKRYKEGPLLAEHGFAALIDLKLCGTRILWDAGITPTTALENMRRMKIDPKSIDMIAISHGHRDHTSGVTDILNAMEIAPELQEWEPNTTAEEVLKGIEWPKVPLVVHPAAFRERWRIPKDEKMVGPMMPPPKEEWEAAGAEIILSEEPYQLAPGCWTTGNVPRRSFEKSGRGSAMAYREGDSFLPDDIEEDQSIIINVKGKGLVVVSGCAHSGIVNTVNYGREISGVEKVWAILGGFHLGRSPDDEIAMTVEEIKVLNPELIAPSHCTGFKAMSQFSMEMPDAFVYGVVGTKYIF
jgi:7,8-dihydropterin-6-yl-methyl-4-(beta-D-ribofuranosyl)aminobenzene 5'-phosphate synthase